LIHRIESLVGFNKLLYYSAKLDELSTFKQTVPVIKYKATDLAEVDIQVNSHIERYVTQAEAGDDFFASSTEGMLTGMLLGHLGACYIRGVGLTMDLKPDEVYLYWSHVSDKHRRRGIYRSLMSAAHKNYATNGFRTSVALVAPDNCTVIRYLESAGYSLKKKIFVLALLRLKVGIIYPFVDFRNSIFLRIKTPKGYFII
jgi:GNAT superfamily N-acetyltransferase